MQWLAIAESLGEVAQWCAIGYVGWHVFGWCKK
jgi:hypothetical protein